MSVSFILIATRLDRSTPMPQSPKGHSPASADAASPEPNAIRAARVAAGLTQTEAASVVHASLRTWQQWEAGDRKMHSGLFELFRIKTEQQEGQQSTSDGANEE